MDPHRIIVVGAGLAGLTAAHRLATAGARVRVLERAAQIGGRARSETLDGFPIERSGQPFWTADRHALGLLEAFGLRGTAIRLAPRGLDQLYRGTRHPIATRSALGVARLRGVRLYQARRVTRLGRLLRRFGDNLDPAAPERAAAHDDRSIYDFGRLYFGSTVLDRWITPFIAAATSCEERETSRALFLRRVRTHRGAFPFVLEAGFEALLEALAADPAPALGEAATAVELDRPAGAFSRPRVRTGRGESRAPDEADAVVLAVPAPEALRLAAPVLELAERDFLSSVGYDPSITFAIASGTRVDRHARWIQVPHADAWPVEAIQVEIGAPGARIPDGSSLTRARATAAFSRAHLDASDREISVRLAEMLRRVHPRLDDAVLFTHVCREERAVPRFGVGHYRGLAQFLSVQQDLCARGRRIYFAGDYLADPTLEGAVLSGLRAAQAVERDLARKSADASRPTRSASRPQGGAQ